MYLHRAHAPVSNGLCQACVLLAFAPQLLVSASALALRRADIVSPLREDLRCRGKAALAEGNVKHGPFPVLYIELGFELLAQSGHKAHS